MSYRGLTVWGFLERVASPRSVPAGGSIAAMSGAMAAALLAKMGRLALRRGSGQALRREGSSLSHDLVVEAEALRRSLVALAYADGQAYESAATLSRSEEATAKEIKAAWQETVSVPLRIAAGCERLLELAETLRVSGLAAADVRAVVVLASACLEVQLLNAEVNLARVEDAAFCQVSEEKLSSLRERLDKPQPSPKVS